MRIQQDVHRRCYSGTLGARWRHAIHVSSDALDRWVPRREERGSVLKCKNALPGELLRSDVKYKVYHRLFLTANGGSRKSEDGGSVVAAAASVFTARADRVRVRACGGSVRKEAR